MGLPLLLQLLQKMLNLILLQLFCTNLMPGLFQSSPETVQFGQIQGNILERCSTNMLIIALPAS